MWKECVDREKDGESPWLHFQEELRDPDAKCNVDLSGMFIGQVKWIKFGHKDSNYNAKGERVEGPSVQKTAADFRGKKVGAGGTLKVQPKKLNNPSDLSLNVNYQIHMELKNKAGDVVSENFSDPTVVEYQKANEFIWANYKELAVSDSLEDMILVLTFMTEQSGITKGTPVARGQLNLDEVLYQQEKNARGQQKNRLVIEMDLVGGEGSAKLDVQLILQVAAAPVKPVEEPKEPAEVEQVKGGDSKDSKADEEGGSDKYAIPNDDNDEEADDGEGDEEEEDERDDEEL